MNKQEAESAAIRILRACDAAEPIIREAVLVLVRQDIPEAKRLASRAAEELEETRRLQQSLLFDEVNDVTSSGSYLLIHCENRLMNLLFWIDLIRQARADDGLRLL